ncbi:ETX/MTX2 family pore-forming toxin [Longispora sp. NPDC051575]|uniref:ETX/MTX2 family pore-forming toxin n=1 Tax=Longispora sp. NPDC051575 TaxID=3154943 RepID=UPI003426DFB1
MSISVSITAGGDAGSSSVTASGTLLHVITDTERSTFDLGDSSLKSAVHAYKGKRPNDAYLRSPTPWNDLYKTYDWPEVATRLKVKSARVTGITSEPVIVAERDLVNGSSVPADFEASITEQVANTTSNTWSKSNTVSVEQRFTYDVKFLGAGGGGETSMSYSHSWGESRTETKEVVVGSTSGVKVRLDPGQSVVARLTASRGVLKIRIEYKASLKGWTACNYSPRYEGHHFWGMSIASVMRDGGLSNARYFTEDIQVGYYSNARIELADRATGAVLASFGVDEANDDDLTLDLRAPVDAFAD